VRSAERVLVLYEDSRAGAAAIDLARDLVETANAEITVVGLAPQFASGSRCGGSATEYNEVVADSVAQDLEHARLRLGGAAGAGFVVLVEGADQTLEQFVRAGGFDLVLLPAHWRPLRKPGHPAASKLSRVSRAEIRIVEPASPKRPEPRPAGAAG
jgi:nucleotide-binding universal stress UspA family protein